MRKKGHCDVNKFRYPSPTGTDFLIAAIAPRRTHTVNKVRMWSLYYQVNPVSPSISSGEGKQTDCKLLVERTALLLRMNFSVRTFKYQFSEISIIFPPHW